LFNLVKPSPFRLITILCASNNFSITLIFYSWLFKVHGPCESPGLSQHHHHHHHNNCSQTIFLWLFPSELCHNALFFVFH
jgi:hypothetical protein